MYDEYLLCIVFVIDLLELILRGRVWEFFPLLYKYNIIHMYIFKFIHMYKSLIICINLFIFLIYLTF